MNFIYRIYFRLALIAIFALGMVVGCCHSRSVAIVNVENLGSKVTTRYRYKVIESHKLKDWLSGTDVDYGGILMAYLKKFQPDVFSDEGIPIVIKKDYDNRSDNSKWWKFPNGAGQEFLCFLYEFPTGFTLPCNFKEEESSDSFILGLVEPEGNGRTLSSFDFYYAHDEVVSALSPFAWLFYIYGNSAPDKFSDGVEFKHDGWTVFSSGRAVDYEAKAYGIAVKLKELEDAGTITEANARAVKEVYARRSIARMRAKVKKEIAKPGPRPSGDLPPAKRSAYRIISLERDKSVDFAYSFELELQEGTSEPMDAFFNIRNKFVAQIRAAYLSDNQGCASDWVYVDTDEKLLDGRFVGRAVVLRIDVAAVNYNPTTRNGFVRLRLGGRQQYEEARKRAKRIIETLARDKNIKLTTGTVPPEAAYYSLGEELKGNVLEIIFTTE